MLSSAVLAFKFENPGSAHGAQVMYAALGLPKPLGSPGWAPLEWGPGQIAPLPPSWYPWLQGLQYRAGRFASTGSFTSHSGDEPSVPVTPLS